MTGMPRSPRVNQGGIVYHVLNRANARLGLFECDEDYGLFIDVLAEAHSRVDMRTIGYCIMPNHWHLVLWPRGDGDLSGEEGTKGTGYFYGLTEVLF